MEKLEAGAPPPGAGGIAVGGVGGGAIVPAKLQALQGALQPLLPPVAPLTLLGLRVITKKKKRGLSSEYGTYTTSLGQIFALA